jgi:hypothetical protein
MPALADTLRQVEAFLGIFAAGYTAFLFAQCEGRDLWQAKWRLFPHLLAQALLAGSVAILPFAPVPGLCWIALGSALAHLGFALLDARGPHHTDNARQAASLLPRIPIRKGSRLMAFSEGLQFTTAAALLAAGLCWFGHLNALVATLLARRRSSGCSGTSARSCARGSCRRCRDGRITRSHRIRLSLSCLTNDATTSS